MTKRFIRIMFDEEPRLGPGRVAMLEPIESAGSIRGAARAMEMSYRRAWLLLEALNQTFVNPVAATRHGGKRGGGATLTPFGREVVQRYRAIESAVRQSAGDDIAFLAQHVERDIR